MMQDRGLLVGALIGWYTLHHHRLLLPLRRATCLEVYGGIVSRSLLHVPGGGASPRQIERIVKLDLLYLAESTLRPVRMLV
jgi:hypothetical protein